MKKFVALALLSFSFAAHAVTYNVTVLNSLGSGDSKAYALNDNGQVVGQSYNDNTAQMESAIWSSGIVQSLGVTGIARGINNSGTVVGETGSASLTQPSGEAYSWTSGGGVNYLGTFGGNHSGAYDINEAGVITGFAWRGDQPQFSTYGKGFIYENGVMNPLGTFNDPEGYSRGQGINDSNEIAGRTSVGVFAGNPKFTTYWDSDQNLNQFQNAAGYSTAEQINNNGLIVGTTREIATGNTLLAATWDTAGTETVLGGIGAFGSKAWSVNDSNQIVGYDQIASGAENRRAFVSFDGSNIVDLNSLVDLTGTGLVSLNEAYDINANGDIVGYGVDANGNEQAFLLTAVPVPAAVWLFGSALGMLGWVRRRKTS